MKPVMYKQRPSYPALWAAAVTLALGVFVMFNLHERIEAGEADSSSFLLAGCITGGVAGALVISAFARYQFTHLWKTPDPAFTRKARKNRRRDRR